MKLPQLGIVLYYIYDVASLSRNNSPREINFRNLQELKILLIQNLLS